MESVIRWSRSNLFIAVILVIIPLIVSCSTININSTKVETHTPIPTKTETTTPEPSQTLMPTVTHTSTLAPSITPTSTSFPTITPSPTLGIGSTIVSPIDGMVMVYVPAGDFLMGISEGFGSSIYPQHSRYLDAYWIDSTEVTNAMFLQFVDVTGYVTRAEEQGKAWLIDGSNYGWVDGVNWRHPNGPESDLIDMENHPVVYVSWNDASAYCAWAGRKLPTNAEWEKAARGTDGRTHPWGEGIDCTMANIAECGVMGTSAIGSYSEDISPFGAFDMAGNVAEYVLDLYEGYYEPSNGSKLIPTSDGIHDDFRGGSYLDILHINSQYFELVGVYESYIESASQSIGFRCALSP